MYFFSKQILSYTYNSSTVTPKNVNGLEIHKYFKDFMYVCIAWMMPLILLQYIYSQSAPFFGIFAAAGSEMLKLQILFFIHFFMVFVVVNKLISFEYQHICMNQGQTDPFVHINYTCRQPFSINFQQDTVTLHSGDKFYFPFRFERQFIDLN